MRYALIAFVLFIANTSSFGQTAAQKTEMQQVVRNFFDALSNLDAATAKSFCTQNVMILESGKIWNFDSLALRINSLKAAKEFKRVNSFDFFATTLAGNTSTMSYFNDATMTIEGKSMKAKWLETVVLLRDAGKWKISLLHSTDLNNPK